MKYSRIGVFAVALLAAACSAAPQDDETAGSYDQALNDPAAVFGFEATSYWTASAGTKTSSTDRTQGSASLGLANFTYAELVSSPLATLSTVSSTVSVDIKAPVSPAWGTAQLFVTIPSRNIYSAALGSVSLAGSTAGAWRTLTFNVPSNVLTALGQSYSDLRFKIALNVPQIAQPYLIDNLRFGATSNVSLVALDVSNVDDYVYVTVNGLRHKVVPINGVISGEAISQWFVPGRNTVRIQGINTGGPGSYTVRLTADGTVVANEDCVSTPCSALPGGTGIVFDRTYEFNAPNAPAARTLTVNGTTGGKIYINDAYTGFPVPHTFTLPQGEYVVGVGVGEGTPGAYVGQFHEQTVSLTTSNATITPTSTPALSFPNHTKVALLPIRETIHGSGGPSNTGVLTANDITIMHGQTIATRDAYVEPFSYGLTTWDIDLLPTVENTPYRRPADAGDAGSKDAFLIEAGLTHLEQTYDIIIYFFSKYTASGAEVANPPCCWWGIGQAIWFPNHGTRNGESPNDPNVYLLHESLHDYESYNDWRLHFYNGADGTHGADEHGYPPGDGGEPDFLTYYRAFMRNQVAEVNTMRAGTAWIGSRPTNADLWVGVFDTMRRGVDWQSASLAAAPNAHRALGASFQTAASSLSSPIPRVCKLGSQ